MLHIGHDRVAGHDLRYPLLRRGPSSFYGGHHTCGHRRLELLCGGEILLYSPILIQSSLQGGDCAIIAVGKRLAAVGYSGEQIVGAESAAIFPNGGDEFGVWHQPAQALGNADLVAQPLWNRDQKAPHARYSVVNQRLWAVVGGFWFRLDYISG